MNPARKTFCFIGMLIALVVIALVNGCQSQSRLPAARYGAKMIFDPIEYQSILFGGRAYGLFGLKYFDDLWAFDVQSLTWQPINTSHRPGARLSPGMVYDPIHHQIILFGGHNSQRRLEDTWIYHIADNHWEEVTPINSPPPRSDMGMVYDSENKIVILFGGYCQDDIRDLCDDTWVYEPESKIWTEMNPALSPPIMYGHTLVYDHSNHQSILWGGHMAADRNGVFSSLGYSNTIWGYDYPNNTWQVIEKISSDIPLARYWHQSTFDSTNGELFTFGGDGGRGFLADTWIFSVATKTWERVSTTESPSPRINAAIVYDPINEIVILFGGLGENQADLQDTWVFKETGIGREWIFASHSEKQVRTEDAYQE